MKVKCLRTILFDLHCSLDLLTPTKPYLIRTILNTKLWSTYRFWVGVKHPNTSLSILIFSVNTAPWPGHSDLCNPVLLQNCSHCHRLCLHSCCCWLFDISIWTRSFPVSSKCYALLKLDQQTVFSFDRRYCACRIRMESDLNVDDPSSHEQFFWLTNMCVLHTHRTCIHSAIQMET